MNDVPQTHRWSISNILYSITIIFTVSGSLILAYWNILQSLNAQQVALASYEARLTLIEKIQSTKQETDERFASEIRAALNNINQGLADLRVQEAKRTR